MSLSHYALVFVTLLCTVNACTYDSECSSNYYCNKVTSSCTAPGTQGATCTPNATGRKQCASNYYCASSSTLGTGICTYVQSNGRSCTSGDQCSSGFCTSSGTCQTNPIANAVEGAAIAITTIILIATISPIVICILICVCCYYCGRRQPVIISNSQPQVMVAQVGVPVQQPMMATAVPMQQQQYYVPQQQPQWPQQQPWQPPPQYAPQTTPYQQPYVPQIGTGGNPYQPLSHHEPQPSTTQVEGIPAQAPNSSQI